MASNVGIGIHRVIQDADGESATVTDGRLDVNATIGATVTVALDSGSDSVECIQDTAADLNATVNLITGFATATLQGAGLPSALSSDNLKVSIKEGNITGFATATLQGGGLPSALSSDNLKVSIQAGNITGFSTATLQGGGLPSALSSDNLKVSIQAGNITGFATSALQPTLGTAGSASANVITVQGVASMTPLIVDISSSNNAVTIDNANNNEVFIAGGATQAANVKVSIENGGFDGAVTAADNAIVILGAKANAKSAATDATAITMMQVLKQISASVQETATDTETIDSDTNDIKTAVELLNNAVDGNYLNVNANIAGTDFVGGAGNVAPGVLRVTLASDDAVGAAMTTHLNTIAGDTTEIESYFKAPGLTYAGGGNPQGLMSLAFREDILGASFSGLGIANNDWTYLQVDTQGALYTTHGTTGMAQGNTTVGASAMQLDEGTDGYDQACKRIDLMPRPTNTGSIYVGSANTIAADGTLGGIRLNAGDFYSIDIDNLTHIWVEATEAGQELDFIYFT